MNRELFISYFKGTLSEQDEKILLDWIDLSDDNKQEFMEARCAWDMMLFSFPVTEVRKPAVWNIRRISLEIAKVAAVVAVVSVIATAVVKRKDQVRDQYTQTIEAPAGQMVKITLPDGTKVWLNSKTKLAYTQGYGSRLRNVKLDGEAYFEVAHDKRHPFIVSTSRFDVKALGTAFNVYAYNESESERFSTTLVEGKVSVTDQVTHEGVYLTPNMKAVVDRGKLKPEAITPNEDVLWKNGIYSFSDMTLESILERLERYYDVKITVKNRQILKNTCTGKFRKSDGVTHILDVIQADIPFSYRYDKDTEEITISE